ncbi:MAG: glycosyltransferase [Sphingomonadales bacterium]|jgi:glycosyltransferase involved in cell wall biosynthesis
MTLATVDAAPVISVIIPHLNAPDKLQLCLASVLSQQLPAGRFEVIVVDNGSRTPLTDVQAAFPAVRFLHEARPGPGLARNTGVAAARGPLLAFIDADCVAAPGWLAAAHNAASRGQIAGGEVTIAAVDPARMSSIEAFESVFGFRQKMYIETKHFSVTANLAMPRHCHDRVGPFGGIDIAEDLDWGQRAHAMGLVLTFRPDMQVWHPARPDFAALCRKWQRHIHHDWNSHRAAAAPAWRWWRQAAMVAASPLVDSVRMLTSSRLAGAGNRLRGLWMLFRIRWWRAGMMLRIMYQPAGDVNFWNR